MTSDLTIVVPSSSNGISLAAARAYEHLVACELVRPCVWVAENETRELMGAVIGSRSAPVETTGDAQWWEPEAIPLLELVARLEPQRIRLVALVLPGDRAQEGDPRDVQDFDLPGRAGRALEQYKSDLQDLSQYAMFVATVDSVAGFAVEASLDPNLLRDQPWINVLVAPEDRADDSAMAVPMACDRGLPFHIATAIASLTATWQGMKEDPLEAWADPHLTLVSASRSRLVIMRSRSRSLTVPTTADSVPASVLAKRATWPVPAGCVLSDSPMMLVDHLASSYLTGPGEPLLFRLNKEVRVEEYKALTWRQLLRRIIEWVTSDLPKQIEADIRALVSRAGDRADDWMTRKILGPNSAFRVDRHGRDVVVETTEDGELVDIFDRLVELGGIELLSRRPPANPDVWREFASWAYAVIDGDRLPDDVESIFTDGTNRQVITDPNLVAPRGDDHGWWTPSQRIVNLLGPSAVRLRPCDVRMARRNREFLEDVVVWLEAVAAAEAAAAAALDGEGSDEITIKHSRWRIVRWWRRRRVLAKRRRAARKAMKLAKRRRRNQPPAPVLVPTSAQAGLVPTEMTVGRSVADEAPTETEAAAEGVAADDTEGHDSAHHGGAATTGLEDAQDATGVPEATGEIEVDLGLPTKEEILEARKSLADAMDARSSSFAWKVGVQLDSAMNDALATFDKFAKEIDEARANPPEIEEVERRKRRTRRFRWSLARGVLLALLGVLSLIFLPFALVILIPIFGVMMFGAIMSAVGGVFRYFRDRFQADHAQKQALTRLDYVRSEIGNVVLAMVRLHSNYNQYLDWSEAVGTMVHRPFGPPFRYEGRTHGTWTGGLHSHQVGEGEIGANTEISLVNSQSVEVFRKGWLNGVWSEAESEVIDEFRLLTAASDVESDPYSDRSTGSFIDPVRDRSARRFLLRAIVDGTPFTKIRTARMEEILERLAKLSPDVLCDVVDGRAPKQWLLDSVPRDGAAAAFPASLWTVDGLMSLPVVDRRTVWTPASLGEVTSETASVVRMVANTDTLASTVVCVDLSSIVDVSAAEAVLAVFGKHAAPPVDRVPVPSSVRLGSMRSIVGFGGGGPDVGHLPQLGDSISPNRAPARPTTGGAYRFMFLVDGRPCRYPADRPIDFHLRVGVGPTEGFQLVRDALQVMSDASGIVFRFAGTFVDLAERKPENGGLWIAFVEPEDFAGSGSFGLGDNVLGHGGVTVSGDEVLGGVVVIGNDTNVANEFGPGHTLGGVLLHEIGHALNLAHVDVQSEQMYPYASEFSPERLGDGDRLGLWLMGAGRGRN